MTVDLSSILNLIFALLCAAQAGYCLAEDGIGWTVAFTFAAILNAAVVVGHLK